MSSAQTSPEAIVGPPVELIPLQVYVDGTFTPETAASFGFYSNFVTAGNAGAIADLSNYRAAILQAVISRPPGSAANAVSVTPYTGPCPDHETHDPIGVDWGVFVAGKANASPGTTEVWSIYLDTLKIMSHVSCSVTVNTGTTALLGVSVIPLAPKYSPQAFAVGDLLEVL